MAAHGHHYQAAPGAEPEPMYSPDSYAINSYVSTPTLNHQNSYDNPTRVHDEKTGAYQSINGLPDYSYQPQQPQYQRPQQSIAVVEDQAPMEPQQDYRGA